MFPSPVAPFMKRLIALMVSIGLLAMLMWHVDTAALMANFRQTRWELFVLAIALFVPQILVIAWRWKRLVSPFTLLPLSESTRLVLAGSSMNLLLPGKLGDLTKGWFLARRGHLSTSLGLGVVAFEKMLDVAALAVFMLVGVAMLAWRLTGSPPVTAETADLTVAASLSQPAMATLLIAAGGLGLTAVVLVAVLYFVPLEKLPGFGRFSQDNSGSIAGKIARILRSTQVAMATLRARGSRRSEILMLSLIIWVLHLAQIYLFFASVGAPPPPGDFFCMIPLAIFIGLLPLSIAGFGTRDAALVALLPAMPASGVLAASFYVNLRYILPAVAGVPYLARYATARKQNLPAG